MGDGGNEISLGASVSSSRRCPSSLWAIASSGAVRPHAHFPGANRTGNVEAELDRSPLVELNPQETMALIQIATAGVRAGTVSESDLSRLHLLGLVEQRGMAMGLTTMGIRTVARLKHG